MSSDTSHILKLHISRHLMTVGMEKQNFLLTRRNLWHKQVKGGLLTASTSWRKGKESTERQCICLLFTVFKLNTALDAHQQTYIFIRCRRL